MADRRLVQARGPFVTMTANGPWAVQVGDLYEEDDPVVVANPDSFDPPLVQNSRTLRAQPRGWGAPPLRPRGVETTTAEPGAVRAPTRPDKPIGTPDPAPAGSGTPGRRPKANRPDGEV